MHYILCITQKCNLACSYCYLQKKSATMSLSTAGQVIDFIFDHNPSDPHKEILLSGGEPLLEFDIVKKIVSIIESHPAYHTENVTLSVLTNGTIFSHEIADFMKKHSVQFSVSCDGPSFVHDLFRRFPDGSGSSHIVESTIKHAMHEFPSLRVHAVYHPKTVRHLPSVVHYLSSLGFTTISVHPDFTAPWTLKEAHVLPEIYGKVAENYIDSSLRKRHYFINLLHNKMHVILRGGYLESQKCSVGKGKLAFDPLGNIYPCEKMMGNPQGEENCIGSVSDGLQAENVKLRRVPEYLIQTECLFCPIKDYCMHWCTCANYFSSGYTNRTGPFLCYHEKAAIQTANKTLQTLRSVEGGIFPVHLRSYLPS